MRHCGEHDARRKEVRDTVSEVKQAHHAIATLMSGCADDVETYCSPNQLLSTNGAILYDVNNFRNPHEVIG